MTDPIADLLTRIRNASAVKKHELTLPSSKLKVALVNVLTRDGWLGAYEEKKITDVKKELTIILKYREDGQPMISDIKRISKPSRQVYIGKDKIRPVRNGFGMAVISTSQGLMTDSEARQKCQGGEVICEVY